MTVSFIRIKNGAYRTTDVSGQVFQLVEQYKNTAKGGYVTVKNGGKFPGFPEDIRVKVDGMSDYEFVSEAEFVEAGNTPVAEARALEVAQESDEEVIERIRQRFEILDEMATAATTGSTPSTRASAPGSAAGAAALHEGGDLDLGGGPGGLARAEGDGRRRAVRVPRPLRAGDAAR